MTYAINSVCYDSVLTRDEVEVRSAPEAAQLAGISYRQLDYWARASWITASRVERVSVNRVVRRYAEDDIVRLAALRHLAQSGLDVARFGPLVGSLEVPHDALVVVGPDETVSVVAAAELRRTVSAAGRWVVFDPAPLRRRLGGHQVASAPRSRRSA